MFEPLAEREVFLPDSDFSTQKSEEFAYRFTEHLLTCEAQGLRNAGLGEIQRSSAIDGYRFSRVATEIVKVHAFGHVRNLNTAEP